MPIFTPDTNQHPAIFIELVDTNRRQNNPESKRKLTIERFKIEQNSIKIEFNRSLPGDEALRKGAKIVKAFREAMSYNFPEDPDFNFEISFAQVSSNQIEFNFVQRDFTQSSMPFQLNPKRIQELKIIIKQTILEITGKIPKVRLNPDSPFLIQWGIADYIKDNKDAINKARGLFPAPARDSRIQV
jgi:hypothetical protein